MIATLLALSVSATPAQLRLGLDARAAVAVSCAQAPEISASSGSVVDLHAEAGGWRATYLPPPSAIPRVAMLAVFCAGEPALLPIPLWGDGDAEVHALPRAVVSVRIGGEVFGPLRTDAAGVARVPVVVPPGVGFAYQGPRAIDLHVPATRTVFLVARQDEIAVDRAGTIPLWAFVVDRAGAPLAAAPLRVSATRGTLAAPVAVAAGIYRLDWSFEAGAPGEAAIEATVEGDPQPAAVGLQLVPGAPARIELVSDRRELSAGDGPLHLRAVVRDAAGNLVPGRIAASASRGCLRVRAAAGAHELELELPGTLGGDRELVVSVAAGAARAEAHVALRSAPPTSLRIVAARPKVLADGRTAVQVRLRAVDRFGNEVDSAPDTSADRGSLTPPSRTASGWEVSYLPPVLHDPASAMVKARDGQAGASARIELDPAVRPLAVSVRGGVFSNFHEVTGPMAGVVAALRTDLLDAQLGVQLSFDVLGWNTTDAAQTTAGARQLRTSLGVGMPGLALEWRRPLSDRAAAWVQGGPLLALASSHTELAGTAAQQDRGLSAGAQGGFGAETRLWRGRALVELRWLAVRSFSLANLQGPLSGLCATLGYRVELF